MILETVLLAGAPSLGAALLYIVRKRQQMAAKKSRLGVDLPIAEYSMLRSWAAKNDMTISDYVRKTLLASVPREEKNGMNGNRKSILEVAFEEAEKQDAFGAGNMMTMPPIRQPQVGVVSEADRTHPLQRVTKISHQHLPQVPPGPHPCAHLTSQVQSNLRGQCQGSCDHAQQRGRPCYWPPTSARQCPLFEGKGAKKGERSRP